MKNVDFNPNDFTYFVLLPDFINRASNGFVLDYFDGETGDQFIHKSRNGHPTRYKFNKSQRMIRIPSVNKELLEAVRNHPQCVGSRNGVVREIKGEKVYVNALFKEMNEQRDAEVVLDAFKIQKEAIDVAFELISDITAKDNALAVLGLKRTGDMGSSDLIQYAKSNPEIFLKQVNAADFKARALVKKAIGVDVLRRDGVMYKSGEFEYGLDIDEAVTTVMKNEDKRRFLIKKVDPNFDNDSE